MKLLYCIQIQIQVMFHFYVQVESYPSLVQTMKIKWQVYSIVEVCTGVPIYRRKK